MIDDLLRETGVTPDRIAGLAVSLGPGSFTGLRVGVSLAKGLAFGWKKPLVGIPTLEVVARQSTGNPHSAIRIPHWIIPIIDAKRGDVYWAAFGSEGDPCSDPSCDASQVVRTWMENHPDRSIVLSGAGLQIHRTAFEGASQAIIAPEDQWIPRAETVALMAEERLQAGKKDDPASRGARSIPEDRDLIGDGPRPKVRGTGGAGGADPAVLAPLYLREFPVRPKSA